MRLASFHGSKQLSLTNYFEAVLVEEVIEIKIVPI